jgi:hypothetical protein
MKFLVGVDGIGGAGGPFVWCRQRETILEFQSEEELGAC